MPERTLFGLCGSLRRASFNRMLMHEAARAFGGKFTAGDLRLPLYDGDLEEAEGIPDKVVQLAVGISSADAVILVTPEYNQSFSGVLKNALDWISRVEGSPWRDKPVAILSAAAGRTGGARAQYALRLAMNSARPKLLAGPEVLVANASQEFDDEGKLVGESYRTLLEELMSSLEDEIE